MLLLDFLPTYVLSDVPGCPTAVAKDALLKATQEFLSRTQAWDEMQDPIDVMDSQADYDMDSPPGAICIDVKAVYNKVGAEVRGVDMALLSQLMPDWATAQGSAPQLYTRAFDFASIRVFPLPINPQAETLRIHGVYTLKDTATSIPDAIVQRYARVLASGAKSRLLAMPKTVASWQDLTLAKYHLELFEDGISSAHVAAMHSKTTGAARVRSRAFGR